MPSTDLIHPYVERAHLTASFGLVRFAASRALRVQHARRAILTSRLEG